VSDCDLDVVGIGNAIVDVLAASDDEFLTGHGIAKGAMTLIDAVRAETLYGSMGPGIECSGGSAANTIAGIAGLGGRAGFIGKVKDDQLGRVFIHDLRSTGAVFDSTPAADGTSTARCLIMVTPDAQRTMNTYLGACVELGPGDIDAGLIGRAAITYLEGYLWDPPEAKKAFRKAIDIAHGAGRKVALTLSDAFCVDRFRDEFRRLIEDEIDILFANEQEIISLYRSADFDGAVQQVRPHCNVVALTRSEKGCVILGNDEIHIIDAAPVDKVVDTTGAGDLFAAGFLYGLTNNRGLAECGRIGGLCAAEIISHYGARPEADLSALLNG